jgi:hypothetical protein
MYEFLVLLAATTANVNTALIAEAKEAVSRNLVNPSATQFRDLRVHRDANGIPIVCGEYNAENRMGGYVGFNRFVYNKLTRAVDHDNDRSFVFVAWIDCE